MLAMKFRLCFLIVVLAFFANSHNAFSDSGRYSTSQPSMEVNAFSQDTFGYVWMATSSGLARFNGSGFMTWTASNVDGELFSENIKSLCHDSDGKLWIGSECGVSFRSGNIFVNTSEAICNPVNIIKEMDEDHILVLCRDGLVKYEKNRMEASAVNSSCGSSGIDFVEVLPSGCVCFTKISGSEAFLYLLDHDLVEKNKVNLGKVRSIGGMCASADGNVYVIADKSIRRFDSITLQEGPRPSVDSVCALSSGGLFMLPYRTAEVLVGLRGKGFYVYVPEKDTVRHIIKTNALPEERYKCFVDKDNRIWISDGKNRVRKYNPRGNYMHFAPFGESCVKDFHHLYFDNDGFLWMNVSGSMCSMDPVSGEIVYCEKDKKCRVVFIDSSGRLWSIFGDDEIRVCSVEHGKPVGTRLYRTSGALFSIAEDAMGRLLLSSVGNKLYVIGTDGSLHCQVMNDVPRFSLLISDDMFRRVFLFTYDEGLFELMTDFTVRKVETGGVKSISYVFPASDGTLWIGTYNDGLVHCDSAGQKIGKFGKESGLPESMIKTIIEDRSGNIWFTTSSAVVEYDVDKKIFRSLHDDEFKPEMCYGLVSSARDASGKIYFGGAGGITAVNPSLPFPSTNEIKLGFDNVFVNGKAYSLPGGDGGIFLDGNDQLLNFRFSGIDFNSVGNLYYSYMLEGYDKNPTYVYGDGSAVYNHLPDGDYVFRVRVRNDDVWGENELCMPVHVGSGRGKFHGYLLLAVLLSGCAVGLWMIWRRTLSCRPEDSDCAEPDASKQENAVEAVCETAEKVDVLPVKENPLYERFEKVMLENLDDDGYSVNDLAASMGMSYSSLYAKLKALTEHTPQQLMMAFRMKKADEFLRSGNFSVGEVAYKVGSSSPTTFSREFKKYFGYPPSNVIKK